MTENESENVTENSKAEDTSGGATAFDPQLLEILRCPISHEPLVHRDGKLLCYASRKAYRIDDGIPVMLAEEAEEIPESEIPAEFRADA